jgi:Ca2+-binding EF-hand superfamily protein
MTRFTLTTAALLLLATQSFAAGGVPGGHFIENWDLDNNGGVSLAEATERRGDVFLTFDADDNGVLNAEEHDLFDEARANDMKENGEGHGKGKKNPANGMLRKFTDANGDGEVTRAEFMDSVPAWFARMDKNGDGNVTTDDFGKGH